MRGQIITRVVQGAVYITCIFSEGLYIRIQLEVVCEFIPSRGTGSPCVDIRLSWLEVVLRLLPVMEYNQFFLVLGALNVTNHFPPLGSQC